MVVEVVDVKEMSLVEPERRAASRKTCPSDYQTVNASFSECPDSFAFGMIKVQVQLQKRSSFDEKSH